MALINKFKYASIHMSGVAYNKELCSHDCLAGLETTDILVSMALLFQAETDTSSSGALKGQVVSIYNSLRTLLIVYRSLSRL
jgi:hypothetical protein